MSQLGSNPASQNSAPDAGNRAQALSEKVRSLRLADKMGQGGGASSSAIYFLFLLVMVLAAGVGYSVFAGQDTLKKLGELEKKIAEGGMKSDEESYEDDLPETPGKESASKDPRNEPRPIGKEEIALQYKGFIVPISQILVSPEVGGRVVWLKFQEGQTVEEGEVLAMIEDIKYRAEYDKAEANLQAAMARRDQLTDYRKDEEDQIRAELEEARVLLVQYKADFDRYTDLIATSAATQRDLDEARSKHDSGKQRLKRLELALKLFRDGPRQEQINAAAAEVKAAEAMKIIARKNLDDTIVTAPVTGTILTKKAEENNQVNPAAFSNGLAASLCEMADLTELEVDVSIVERDRAQVYLHQECRIRVDAWPRKVYEGYVSRIMPQADRGKNAIPVRVKITKKRLQEDREGGGPYLLPEMSAVVMFLNNTVNPAEFEKR